ncbi:MAG: aminomethyltransferase [Actinomycetota bacterium]|jgi:aminomethyltransferase|nr:aminomethyltransferase [Actinomycetota bacterium]
MGDRATVLLDAHRELGAKLTEFGGWEMPLQYEGIVSEHRAVRTGTGVFDVSHLGKLRVQGPGAGDALQETVTADVMGLAPGRAAYSLVLTEDGGCVDDVFVYRFGEDEWLVVPNASNVSQVADMIRRSGAEPVDEWDRWTILAIQGPDSFAHFQKVWPDAGATDLKLHDFCPIDVFGSEGFVARTGYTGERGFELYAPAATALQAWDALLAEGVTPVGLGARDTLRLEMGYALYGHEIDLDTNPLEAGLGWVLSWDAPFRGRDRVAAVKAEGRERQLFGIVCRDKGVPRQGYDVYRGDELIGRVTSGNFSPTLGTGIALALGPTDVAPSEGDTVAVEARGRRIAGDIVKPPFIKKGSS